MIAYFDYRPEFLRHREEFEGAMARVLESGRLVLGPEVEAFEEEFAGFVGAKHAVGVGTGTDAIALSLRALGLGEGDEVLTVANAGVAPLAGIRAAGAIPRLVDVDPRTLLIDPARLEGALTERTRAILPVHLYGNPVPLEAIEAFAQRHDLALVEDCAQAHGARYQDRFVGCFGAVGCFSFYPTKNLGAFGDGGICVTDDAGLAAKLREQRMYGFHGDGIAHVEGRNSRLDELQAAILRVKLRHFDATLAERRHLASLYRKELQVDGQSPVDSSSAALHAYHLFVVRFEDRQAACKKLERAGVGFAIHYPLPVHKMAAYAFLDRPGELSISEAASHHVLSLPLYPGLLEAEVSTICRVLAEDLDAIGEAGA